MHVCGSCRVIECRPNLARSPRDSPGLGCVCGKPSWHFHPPTKELQECNTRATTSTFFMYCRRAGGRNIARCINPSKHVWISDNFLAETFQQFAHRGLLFKRYGSNVPGPLEARRRLAKRRMAGTTAYTPSWNIEYDLSVLFGFTKHQVGSFQWEPPKPTPVVVDQHGV